MKVISNEKTGTNTVELEIQVSGERLQQKMNEVYTEQGINISVPGFRKGKAPRKIIEKMYGESVFLEDAVNKLYPEAYAEALKEIDIDPVAPGDVEIVSVDVTEGLVFKAVVTTKPEVTVGNYKGITATKVTPEIPAEQVDAEMDRLRQRGARMVDIDDRAAENGDNAVIDFEGFVDEVAFDGGKAEGHQLELGSNSFIPGFEEQIIGKNIGEAFDVTVTFPEEYHAEELAGKPAVFTVTLHELKKTELPALDDEFAKDVSEFDTLDELKEDTRTTMLEQAEQTAQDDLENALVDDIVKNLEGEIPEVMYESRVDQMVHDFEHRLQSQGMNLDLYLQYTGSDMESFRKTFREQAERQVKIRLALEKIVSLENIEPSTEDLDKEYQRMAEMYQMTIEQVKELVLPEDLAPDVAANLAIDMIRENAVITKISAEEKRMADEQVAKAAEAVAKKAEKAAEAVAKKAEKDAEAVAKKAEKDAEKQK